MIFDLPVLDFETPLPSALGIKPLLDKVKIFLDKKINRYQGPLGYIRAQWVI